MREIISIGNTPIAPHSTVANIFTARLIPTILIIVKAYSFNESCMEINKNKGCCAFGDHLTAVSLRFKIIFNELH